MSGNALSLGFMALGSIGFLILLIAQTISTEHESPSTATVVFSFAAFLVFSIGAVWAALLARREKRRGTSETKK